MVAGFEPIHFHTTHVHEKKNKFWINRLSYVIKENVLCNRILEKSIGKVQTLDLKKNNNDALSGKKINYIFVYCKVATGYDWIQ